MRRVWLALTCNWFTIALHCAIHGHDWREDSACLAVGFTSCAYCGQLRGHYRKDNGHEKCSRIDNSVGGIMRRRLARLEESP